MAKAIPRRRIARLIGSKSRPNASAWISQSGLTIGGPAPVGRARRGATGTILNPARGARKPRPGSLRPLLLDRLLQHVAGRLGRRPRLDVGRPGAGAGAGAAGGPLPPGA